MKLLKALPFPGRWCVFHNAVRKQNTVWNVCARGLEAWGRGWRSEASVHFLSGSVTWWEEQQQCAVCARAGVCLALVWAWGISVVWWGIHC